MTFFTRQDIGRVYVIKMILPGDLIIHKIGMCHADRSLDRMMEILRSWFSSYRFVPYTELRLDMECQMPKALESHIHKVLDKHRFIPHHDIEGKTEMFCDLDELRVLHYLRTFNEAAFPLELSDQDYKHLCQLISPSI